MQNSLDRLFEGIALALRRDIAPHLTDPYAKAQVSAAVELLGNLASRVIWAGGEDESALVELSAAVADGTADPDLRRSMLAALDAELSKLRGARYPSERE